MSLMNLPVEPKSVLHNPSPEKLRELTEAMPQTRITEFGNTNTQTQVLARSKGSTFIVADDPSKHSDQTMSREEYDEIARMQDEHIKGAEMIVIDGWIGNDPDLRVPARLMMETAHANIAAMQQILYYPVNDGDDFEPELHVIYTPTLKAPGRPEDRCIAVDLDNRTTRVLNSDYFGESKKGGLRMWNQVVYDKGGLALHAGCKAIPVGDEIKTCLIVGLSGTGKTTTTFTKQNDSRPVQDDFIALMPDGTVGGTENGCFAKTYGLDPKDEPAIHAAVTSPGAYLENVSQDDDGKVDFFDESYTQNGRAVIRMSDVDGALDPRECGKADFLLILNRNENIIPGVARLTPEQAAAYFMLGETQGTSAGGKEEAGKNLRVPGTNPFFPLLHAQQGNRFLELARSTGMSVYLMNTGRVGGSADVEGSKKVRIPHSSALVKAVAEGTIEWQPDDDFGYEIAASVPGIDDEDMDILQPKRLYEAQGRMDEYNAQVERLKNERREYFESWPGLSDELKNAI